MSERGFFVTFTTFLIYISEILNYQQTALTLHLSDLNKYLLDRPDISDKHLEIKIW